MPKETSVEKRLILKAREAGGDCFKWMPVTAGLPDRVVLLPPGRIFFVETKADKGEVRPVQRVMHRRMEQIGVPVYLLWNREQVDAWVEERMSEVSDFERLAAAIGTAHAVLENVTTKSLMEQAERIRDDRA